MTMQQRCGADFQVLGLLNQLTKKLWAVITLTIDPLQILEGNPALIVCKSTEDESQLRFYESRGCVFFYVMDGIKLSNLLFKDR